MLNKFSIIYIILLLCSTVVVFLGALSGIKAGWNKPYPQLGPEERRRLDERLYLSFSCLGLGLVMRLALAPAWFFMLESLVGIIPGAMCLTGVHQNVPVVAWFSSSMKLLLPAIYVAWLIAGMVDRKFVEQPLLAKRTAFLVPLLVLLVAETGADIAFFFLLKPVPVSCCNLIFTREMVITAGSFALWQRFFQFSAIVTGIMLLVRNSKPVRQRVGAILGVGLNFLFIVFLLLAMHLTPTPLNLPDYVTAIPEHRCIFCLLQRTQLLTAFLLLVTGSVISSSVHMVAWIGAAKIDLEELGHRLGSLRKSAFLLLIVGLVMWLMV